MLEVYSNVITKDWYKYYPLAGICSFLFLVLERLYTYRIDHIFPANSTVRSQCHPLLFSSVWSTGLPKQEWLHVNVHCWPFRNLQIAILHAEWVDELMADLYLWQIVMNTLPESTRTDFFFFFASFSLQCGHGLTIFYVRNKSPLWCWYNIILYCDLITLLTFFQTKSHNWYPQCNSVWRDTNVIWC